jgi:hypothetical protein
MRMRGILPFERERVYGTRIAETVWSVVKGWIGTLRVCNDPPSGDSSETLRKSKAIDVGYNWDVVQEYKIHCWAMKTI